MTSKPWYAPRDPKEIEPLPWLHPEAVEFFDSIVKPDWNVLEHGAGGSTLWLALRVKNVVTIEHDPEWRMNVRNNTPANVTLIEEIPSSKQPLYDCFFIDGAREERGPCILKAIELVVPGGWIVLDNSNRPEYANERRSLIFHSTLMKRTSHNVGESKYFVTEFWKCD